MPKGRKRVCVLCGKTIDDINDSVPYKKRYAHADCFNIAVKAVHVDKTEKLEEKSKENPPKRKGRQARPKAELKDSVTEEEYKQKKAYYDFLKTTLEDNLPAKVYVLTEKYINQYSFTYEKMLQTLIYLKEILEKDFTADIVGLIPYYYETAEHHNYAVKKVEENNKDKDIGSMYHKKTIFIQPKKKERKQIDLTSVGKEE